jgi:hypothetical protein
MKISELSSLESLPYFTLEGVKQLLGDESTSAGTIRTALYRWMKAGHIFQLKKGVYMTRRFFDLHRADADFSPAISAILIPQSYVSVEYILQRHSILTEVTYPVSAVTLKNTRMIESKLGIFTYHHINENLYTGFTISNYLGIPFACASAAKALFDYLYFRPVPDRKYLSTHNLGEELRLNLEDLSIRDQTEFAEYVETSHSAKMERILNNLRSTLWQL